MVLLGSAAITVAACVLFATKTVTVKLLPFDNKSEVQVVADLPDGASLEATERVLMAAAAKLGDLDELTHIQAYVGTAAPFNFNGLVRHYYLRGKPWEGDLQINLKPKHERDRQSHAVALEIRERLKDLPVPAGTSVKVVEVPPGPPVLSTLLAEIYGPDTETRRAAAAKVRQAFDGIDFVVDTDDTLGAPAERLRFEVDQENLEFHGVHEEALYNTINVLLGGVSVGYSQRGGGVDPIEIAIRMPKEGLSFSERLLATPVPSSNWATWSASNGKRPPIPCSATTVVSPNWSPANWPGASRPRSTACSLLTTPSPPWIGARPARPRSPITASRTTNAGSRSSGTANGRSPTSPSATWASPSLYSRSTCWSSASSAASSCRW